MKKNLKNITPGFRAGGTASANGQASLVTGDWSPPEVPVTTPFTLQTTLTTAEENELIVSEDVIQKGWMTLWRTSLDAGRALINIRDKRLYRDGYSSFEEYCRDRWQMHRSYGYRLIGAAEVMRDLSPIGDTALQPEHESQIRPLAALNPEDRRTAWQSAVASANGKAITARLVAKAAAVFRPPQPKEVVTRSKSKIGRLPQAAKLTGVLNDALALIDQVTQILGRPSQPNRPEILLQGARAKLQLALRLVDIAKAPSKPAQPRRRKLPGAPDRTTASKPVVDCSEPITSAKQQLTPNLASEPITPAIHPRQQPPGSLASSKGYVGSNQPNQTIE